MPQSQFKPTSIKSPSQTRGFTSVSLTLRPPSSEPQTPVDVSSSGSLTYHVSSPVDSRTSLQISVGRSSWPTSSDDFVTSTSSKIEPANTHLQRASSCLSQSSRESSPIPESTILPVNQQTEENEDLQSNSSPSYAQSINPWWSSTCIANPEASRTQTIDEENKKIGDRLERKDEEIEDTPKVNLFDNVSTLTWRRPDASTGAIPKSRHNTSANVVGKSRSVKVPRTLSFQQLPQQLELIIPNSSDDDVQSNLPENPEFNPKGRGALLPALQLATNTTLATSATAIPHDIAEPLQIQCGNETTSFSSGQPNVCPEDEDFNAESTNAKHDSGEASSDIETSSNNVPDDCEDDTCLPDDVDVSNEDDKLDRRIREIEEDIMKELDEVEDEHKEAILTQLQTKYILQLMLEDKLREKEEFEEDVKALNDLIKESKQDKVVQQLRSEIYQLQLACEKMINEIDQHTNGEVPLGETNAESLQNFRVAQPSTSLTANSDSISTNEPSKSTARAAATATAATFSTAAASNDVDSSQEEVELRWFCKKCTYSNHHLMVECEMCATPRDQRDSERTKEDKIKKEADEPIKVQGTNT